MIKIQNGDIPINQIKIIYSRTYNLLLGNWFMADTGRLTTQSNCGNIHEN